MEEGLNSYGLYLRENDAKDRENIDFIREIFFRYLYLIFTSFTVIADSNIKALPS